MLKNVLHVNVSLKPFNLIAAILNQSNPTLNSIALLVLCLCLNDNILNKKLNFHANDTNSEDQERFCLFVILRKFFEKKQVYDNEDTNNDTKNDEEFLTSHCTPFKAELTNNFKENEMSCISSFDILQERNSEEKPVKKIKTHYICANDMSEFYSKIGSRLGRDY